jgi:Integrase core domain
MAFSSRYLPRAVVVDNGPELTSKAMFRWSQCSQVEIRFIQPGQPSQKAFVKSFDGKLRGLLERTLVYRHCGCSANHRRLVHYDQVRPHTALGYCTTEDYRLAVGKAVETRHHLDTRVQRALAKKRRIRRHNRAESDRFSGRRRGRNEAGLAAQNGPTNSRWPFIWWRRHYRSG